nr:immunoglobulin heavy chain junction region [Macaca mulatta]MOW78618.1 immunoglobulin heavy chain junction region [Macaca mulatta]MOW79174.1 immunoglobulin heavy chain junction region [Macaca mulatta]MOW79415.1 immunoglobulin heavy chain junction region [Macaca mulatta]MOW81915.1 immunoglobulin heavy chain junction region [Macaca mulatta]
CARWGTDEDDGGNYYTYDYW